MNISLQMLEFTGLDFGVHQFAPLRTFFVENPNLVSLDLTESTLGLEDAQMLSEAFRDRRNPSTIECIILKNASIRDEIVPQIVEMCNSCPRLLKLDLGYNYDFITADGCNGMASLLENPRCKIKRLYLNRNTIGDEGLEILANALTDNKRLRELAPFGSVSITGRSWGSLLTVLCDPTSIIRTFESNHYLRCLFRGTDDREDYDRHVKRNPPPTDVEFCLSANQGNPTSAARDKIFHFHLRGDFDMTPFFEMDEGNLPHVFGWVGREYFTGNDQCRLQTHMPFRSIEEYMCIMMSAFYRILRNIPALCGYPSPVRKFQEELVKENASLKSKNAVLNEEVGTLQVRIKQLIEEVELLKSNKRQKL